MPYVNGLNKAQIAMIKQEWKHFAESKTLPFYVKA